MRFAFASLLLVCCLAPAQWGQAQTQIPVAAEAKLGMGFNSFANRVEGECVEGRFLYGPSTGSTVSYEIELVRSYDEFQRETSAEASLSKDFANFSFKVEASFKQEANNKTDTQHLLIKERVVFNPNVVLRGPKLVVTPPAMGDVESLATFSSQCGDQYIAEVQMGGEFIAMLTSTMSEQELKSQLDISANFSGFGASGSAQFQDKIKHLREDNSLRVLVNRLGGAGDLAAIVADKPATTIDNLLAYTRNFPNQIEAQNFDAIGYVAKDYSKMGVNAVDVTEERTRFEQVENGVYSAFGALRQLSFLQAVLNRFNIPDNPGPDDISQRTAKQIADTQRIYDKLSGDAKACASQFWIRGDSAPCNFSQEELSYKAPTPDVITVKKIKVTSQAIESFKIDRPSTLTFRGDFCWDGDRNKACAHNGINLQCCSGPGQWGYVNVQYPTASSGFVRYTKPLQIGPGQLSVKLIDDPCCYSDNWGDFWIVIY